MCKIGFKAASSTESPLAIITLTWIDLSFIHRGLIPLIIQQLFCPVITKQHNGTEQSWDTGKMGCKMEMTHEGGGDRKAERVDEERNGLMYERMCFQRGKGEAMAAGSDTVPVLLQCQNLLWLSNTFPPS